MNRKNRRSFLRKIGFVGAGLLSALSGLVPEVAAGKRAALKKNPGWQFVDDSSLPQLEAIAQSDDNTQSLLSFLGLSSASLMSSIMAQVQDGDDENLVLHGLLIPLQIASYGSTPGFLFYARATMRDDPDVGESVAIVVLPNRTAFMTYGFPPEDLASTGSQNVEALATLCYGGPLQALSCPQQPIQGDFGGLAELVMEEALSSDVLRKQQPRPPLRQRIINCLSSPGCVLPVGCTIAAVVVCIACIVAGASGWGLPALIAAAKPCAITCIFVAIWVLAVIYCLLNCPDLR